MKKAENQKLQNSASRKPKYNGSFNNAIFYFRSYLERTIQECGFLRSVYGYPTTTNQSTTIRITVIKDAACKLCGKRSPLFIAYLGARLHREGRYRWRQEKVDRELTEFLKKGLERGTAVLRQVASTLLKGPKSWKW